MYEPLPELNTLEEKIEYFKRIPNNKAEHYKNDIWYLGNLIIEELQKK